MATVTPFKSKAEERAGVLKAKLECNGEAPSAKRACSAYDKQMSKMEGDTTLMKEILNWKNLLLPNRVEYHILKWFYVFYIQPGIISHSKWFNIS